MKADCRLLNASCLVLTSDCGRMIGGRRVLSVESWWQVAGNTPRAAGGIGGGVSTTLREGLTVRMDESSSVEAHYIT